MFREPAVKFRFFLIFLLLIWPWVTITSLLFFLRHHSHEITDHVYFGALTLCALATVELFFISIKINKDHTILSNLTNQKEEQNVNNTKLMLLGEMTASIAHEINNPLAIIQLKAELLSEELEKQLPQDHLLVKSAQKIHATSERIVRIIHSIRSFARDSTKDPMIFTPISEILEETRFFCEEKLQMKGIELFFFPPVHELKVECRSVQIIQVLANLINNAADAVENLKERWVKIEVQELERFFEIRIEDSGLGIPKEIQAKLMQGIFTTKDVKRGTGLGLTICRRIIDAHGGLLFLDTESSHTCFVVRLLKKQKLKA